MPEYILYIYIYIYSSINISLKNYKICLQVVYKNDF